LTARASPGSLRSVLARQRQIKSPAEKFNILAVVVGGLVCAVEAQLFRRRKTWNGSATHLTDRERGSQEMGSRVGSAFIPSKKQQFDRSSARISQDPSQAKDGSDLALVGRQRVAEWCERLRCAPLTIPGAVDQEIDVTVAPGLRTKQCVNTPTAANPGRNASPLQRVQRLVEVVAAHVEQSRTNAVQHGMFKHPPERAFSHESEPGSPDAVNKTTRIPGHLRNATSAPSRLRRSSTRFGWHCPPRGGPWVGRVLPDLARFQRRSSQCSLDVTWRPQDFLDGVGSPQPSLWRLAIRGSCGNLTWR
jgi:hypothetical protein